MDDAWSDSPKDRRDVEGETIPELAWNSKLSQSGPGLLEILNKRVFLVPEVVVCFDKLD